MISNKKKKKILTKVYTCCCSVLFIFTENKKKNKKKKKIFFLFFLLVWKPCCEVFVLKKRVKNMESSNLNLLSNTTQQTLIDYLALTIQKQRETEIAIAVEKEKLRVHETKLQEFQAQQRVLFIQAIGQLFQMNLQELGNIRFILNNKVTTVSRKEMEPQEKQGSEENKDALGCSGGLSPSERELGTLLSLPPLIRPPYSLNYGNKKPKRKREDVSKQEAKINRFKDWHAKLISLSAETPTNEPLVTIPLSLTREELKRKGLQLPLCLLCDRATPYKNTNFKSLFSQRRYAILLYVNNGLAYKQFKPTLCILQKSANLNIVAKLLNDCR